MMYPRSMWSPVVVQALAVMATSILAEPAPHKFKTALRFTVERIHAVARDSEVSLVALAADHAGRLYASDQGPNASAPTSSRIAKRDPSSSRPSAGPGGGSRSRGSPFESRSTYKGRAIKVPVDLTQESTIQRAICPLQSGNQSN